MSQQSMQEGATAPATAPTNPYEAALQSLCKQLLKSRIFRGFYMERRYVDQAHGYRDVVALHKSEKNLEKMLHDIRNKLQLFYNQQNPRMWIGISNTPLTGFSTAPAAALESYMFVELKDVAFGQYWFSIKSIRFRDNEIIIKLKELQAVTEEETPKWSPSKSSNKVTSDNISHTLEASTVSSVTSSIQVSSLENQITFTDFQLLLQQWWATIKQTIYDFMAQDISKENIVATLRFLGLLLVSIISGALVAIKFLGIFTIRFMFELSRLTHVLTPIFIKLIDVLNKIIGGFYILLAMIWKDTVVKRNQTKYQALEYNRPVYKSIEYDVRQRKQAYSANLGEPFQ